MRKLLLLASLSLVGLIFTGAAVRAQTTKVAAQSGQQPQQTTKSVAGTVTSIGSDGRSFALQVSQGNDKQTLNFTLDKDSQVQGQVKVGTAVTVEYVAMAGQNVARTVTAQG